MKWLRRRKKHEDSQPELEAAEQATRESEQQAARDAADAREMSAHAREVADRLRRLNAANGFSDWVVRRIAQEDR